MAEDISHRSCPPDPSPPPFGSDRAYLRTALRLQQSAAWHRGQRVLVEVYRQSYPALRTDAETFQELVANEIALREAVGETPRLEEYLERLPELEPWLRQQFAIHETIRPSLRLAVPGAPVSLPTGDNTLTGVLTQEYTPPIDTPTTAYTPNPDRSADTPETDSLPDGSPAATQSLHALPTQRRKQHGPPPANIPGYEVLGELGRGGMGVVYKARQLKLNRIVALKMVLGGAHAGAQALVRFLQEAETVAKLRHPNIVQIFEFGSCDGKPFFSLEFVEGGSLADRLQGEPVPPKNGARLVETLARTMQVAHEQGIIHRDLKPANVLLQTAASGLQPLSFGTPKITDFGLAKQANSGMTATGTVLGTPSYMAPEQAAGRAREIGPAADVYALGAILYELLTGRPPFRGPTLVDTLEQVRTQEPVPPRRLQPTVPADLETICLKCLRKESAERYATAADLADDLRRFCEGEPVAARRFSVLDRLARSLDRNRHGAEFHAWAGMIFMFAFVIFVTHLGVFVFHEFNLGPGWPRNARVLQFAILAVLFGAVRLRSRSLMPANVAEQQLWSIWLGYVLACLLVTGLSAELSTPQQTADDSTLYPYWSLMTGLAFFAMGTQFWGRSYLFGLAFFVLGTAMPSVARWSPLLYGTLWCVTLCTLGVHLARNRDENE